LVRSAVPSGSEPTVTDSPSQVFFLKRKIFLRRLYSWNRPHAPNKGDRDARARLFVAEVPLLLPSMLFKVLTLCWRASDCETRQHETRFDVRCRFTSSPPFLLNLKQRYRNGSCSFVYRSGRGCCSGSSRCPPCPSSGLRSRRLPGRLNLV